MTPPHSLAANLMVLQQKKIPPAAQKAFFPQATIVKETSVKHMTGQQSANNDNYDLFYYDFFFLH